MDSSQRSDITQSVHRSSGSFELVIGAVLFSLIGLLVDRSAGTTPLFMLLFAFAGFIGAAVSIYYRYKAAIAAQQQTLPSFRGTNPEAGR